MNFDLSPAELEFRDHLREWLSANVPARREVGPLWGDAEIEHRRAWQRKLQEGGYIGLAWPEEHGGRGATLMEQVIFNEEIARSRVPEPLNIIGLYMIGPTIIRFGTPEQKKRYLRNILTADEIWCQGFSEPDAGSDLGAIRCAAVDKGDHYEVSGQKVWTTLARVADWCMLLVRTGDSPSPNGRPGFTMVIVEMRSPGVTVRSLRDITGGSQFNAIFFDSVVVPKHQTLGPEGKGWNVAMTTLSHERGTLALDLAGRLELNLAEVLELARARSSSFTPERRDILRQELAQLNIEARALKLNGYRALPRILRTGDPGPEGAMGRLQWSQINQRLQELALEVAGLYGMVGNGASTNSHVEDFLRSQANSIAGGTSEILRNAIAERVLGLPRSR
jgi:alkylation response protein AidB-like acyl-CoA dehydrogenase